MSSQENVEVEFKDLQEDLLMQQTKTFTKWVNSYLGDDKVINLFEDLADGEKLLKLLQVISGEQIGKINTGKTTFHKIENINKCLNFLHSKVRLESIGAEDIIKGNHRLIMGLLWTIIIGFQIQGIFVPEDNDTQTMIHTHRSAREALLFWCQQRTTGYRWIHIDDFSTSWRDGMAFNALIHSERADLINYSKLNRGNHIENLENAFNIAESKLGIPKLIDAEDVDVDHPDEKSIITYLSQFYHVFMKSPNWKRIVGSAATVPNHLDNPSVEIIDKSTEAKMTAETKSSAQTTFDQKSTNGHFRSEILWKELNTRPNQKAVTTTTTKPSTFTSRDSLRHDSGTSGIADSRRQTSEKIMDTLGSNRRGSTGQISTERQWPPLSGNSVQKSKSINTFKESPFRSYSSVHLKPSKSLTDISDKTKPPESILNPNRKTSIPTKLTNPKVLNGYMSNEKRWSSFNERIKPLSASGTTFTSTTSTKVSTTTSADSTTSKSSPNGGKLPDSAKPSSEDAWACAYCPSVNLSTSNVCGSCKRNKTDKSSTSLPLAGRDSHSITKSTFSSLSPSVSSSSFSPNTKETKRWWTPETRLSGSTSSLGSLGHDSYSKTTSVSSWKLTASPFRLDNDPQEKDSLEKLSGKTLKLDTVPRTPPSKPRMVSENKFNSNSKINTSSSADKNEVNNDLRWSSSDSTKTVGKDLKGSFNRWSSFDSTKTVQHSGRTEVPNPRGDILKESLEARVAKLEKELQIMKTKYQTEMEASNAKLQDLTSQISLLRNENDRLATELDEIPLLKNKMSRMEQMLHAIANNIKRI